MSRGKDVTHAHVCVHMCVSKGQESGLAGE